MLVNKTPVNDEFYQNVLSMLGAHFKTAKLEKYENAILNTFFNEGLKKHQKGAKVGAHAMGRVQKYMIEKTRLRYGPYVNILRRKCEFLCNFNLIYKTEFGRLYQSSNIPDLFITTHALDRYNDRLPDFSKIDIAAMMDLEFKQKWGTRPTAYDNMERLLLGASEYGIPTNQADTLIINLLFGYLVLDVFEKFSVAKTFLLPNMDIPRCEWFIRTDGIKAVDASILEDSEPIEGPMTIRYVDGQWEACMDNFEFMMDKLE